MHEGYTKVSRSLVTPFPLWITRARSRVYKSATKAIAGGLSRTSAIGMQFCRQTGIARTNSAPLSVKAEAPMAQPLYPPDPLFPRKGLCYNLRAVERAAKAGATSVHPENQGVQPEPGVSISLEPAPGGAEPKANGVSPEKESAAPHEDASRYCPVCSQRLTSRRCKLICTVCGYYMSCADYY